MSGTSVVFQLFLTSSRIQRKRAYLTIAAIAWGTVALLLLLAFGEGLRHQMSTNMAGMGSGIGVFWPGETTKGWQGLPPGRPIRPRIDDVAMLRERMPELDGIVGEMRSWQTSLTWGRTTINARVTGTTVEYGDLRNHIARPGGRFLNELDDQQRRRVIFLGNELADQLFAKEEPVGRVLLVNNVPYTVIGVMQKKMQMGTYGGPDASNAAIPIQTFRAQFGRDQLANLVIRPRDPDQMKAAIARVRELLSPRYGFDPADEPALGCWDTVESGKVTRNVLLGIQIFLGIIGGLTLTIGGVGVANIMYATVKERTREIGVKMALGARPAWITAPLLLEGLAYTLTGGLLGLVGATFLVAVLGMIPTDGNEALQFLGKPTLSLTVGLASAGILGAVGLLAAYFPARRAAAIDPAQTLRYE
jgi:putative ABC transport system permease protein